MSDYLYLKDNIKFIKNDNLDVISSLFESSHVNINCFPEQMLKRFASGSGCWEAQEKSKQHLKKRDDYIELGDNPLPLAEMLKRTELEITTSKFLKKFRESGYVEQQQKQLESGKDATVDILTTSGKSYGINGCFFILAIACSVISKRYLDADTRVKAFSTAFFYV